MSSVPRSLVPWSGVPLSMVPRSGVPRTEGLRDGGTEGLASLSEHVFHVADENVAGQPVLAEGVGEKCRQTADRGREVQLLADDRQSGGGDLRAEARHGHFLEQVVVLDFAAPRERDERVLVRRFLERPGGVAGEERERGEGDPPPEEQVQRQLDLQTRQVRSRE